MIVVIDKPSATMGATSVSLGLISSLVSSSSFLSAEASFFSSGFFFLSPKNAKTEVLLAFLDGERLTSIFLSAAVGSSSMTSGVEATSILASESSASCSLGSEVFSRALTGTVATGLATNQSKRVF